MKEFIRLLTLFSGLFLFFYFIFYFFYNPIHNFYQATDPQSIIWWQQGFISRDGLELPFMVILSVLYLFLAFVLTKRFNKLIFLDIPFIQLLILLPLLFILIGTRSEIFSLLPNPSLNIFIILFIPGLILFSYKIGSFIKNNKYISLIISILLWLILAIIIILSADLPNNIDYNFIISPALKISQGELFKSFYMQYGLFITMIFKGMMDLGMKISQIQIILSLIFVSWFYIYFYLLNQFLKEKFLLYLFIISLLIYRFLSMPHDAIAYPQTLPIRLELWVPLMLVIYKFGFLSIITSIVIAIIYLGENTFGLTYLGLYVIFLCYMYCQRFFHQSLIRKININQFNSNLQLSLNGLNPKLYLRDANLSILGINKQFALLFLPLFIALVLNYYLFGSFTSPAANFYNEIQLGFLSISQNSLFWIIFASLPYFLFIFSKETNEKLRACYFFLLGLNLTQLIYFFGRSHDQNLLNISGIFLVNLFISFDLLIRKYPKRKLLILTLITLFITFSSLCFAGSIQLKFDRIIKHLEKGKITDTTSLEKFVNNNPDLLRAYQNNNKVLILSQFDGYINYRYKIPQQGFITPFYIHVYTAETADFLIKSINNGYKVVLWEDEITELIEQLNQTEMIKRGLKFNFIDQGQTYELEMEKYSATNSNNLWLSYNFDNQLTFQYPKTWRIKKSEVTNEIIITDPTYQFIIAMTFLPTSLALSTSNNIIWKDNEIYKAQYLIPLKDERILNIIVYPVDSSLMRRFYLIMKSIKIN